jgi:ribose transport system permease protein
MQSLKSDALEPDPNDLRGKPLLYRLQRLIPVYGLVVITLILIVLFSILLPNTFPTSLNLESMLKRQSINALMALAVMIPMAAGKIDLSIGFGIMLWEIMAISLQTRFGIPWGLVIPIVLLGGAIVGVFNAILVEFASIDAFIATLGTATVINALALWYTNGQQVVGDLPSSFFGLSNSTLLGIPILPLYPLVISIALWIMLEYLPIGRYIYVVGANPEAAKLNGIPTRKYIVLAFVLSGMIVAFAGVILASQLRIGQTSLGDTYLLPALVGAFLGSTTLKPGRVNVWGTMVAVAVLAIGITGLQQLGAEFYVEPMFNGLTLLLAIGLAGLTGRRRVQLQRAREIALHTQSPSSTTPSSDNSSK